MMRPRSVILSLSSVLVLAYPLVLWQKERLFSSVPVMDAVAGWFWIVEPLALALLFFAVSTRIRQKILQYACIVAASFFLTCAAAEIYFTFRRVEPSGLTFTVKSGHATHLKEEDGVVGGAARDPLFGYGPLPGGKVELASSRVRGGKVLYEVLYTTGEGRRSTPDRGDKADTAIFLFGCSFTFGAGLNDQDTFAWQLGDMLGERFQVFNYGFNGYGPHQMLALVTSGRLDGLMRRYKHIYASYLAIPGHAARCAGLSPWDQFGPRYILENGAPKYVGAFNETLEHNKLYQADRLFSRSQLYEQVFKEAYRSWRIPDHALDALVAITATSMQELAARYHAHAITVLWPKFAYVEPILRNNGIRTLQLTGVMPDFASAPENYEIKGDGHPNALANTRVAEALAEYILRHPPKAKEQDAR
jgi:hypothetical protein